MQFALQASVLKACLNCHASNISLVTTLFISYNCTYISDQHHHHHHHSHNLFGRIYYARTEFKYAKFVRYNLKFRIAVIFVTVD